MSSIGIKTIPSGEENLLKKLGTDYLDLYLIHRPMGDYYGAYKAMEEMYKEGRLSAIGEKQSEFSHNQQKPFSFL